MPNNNTKCDMPGCAHPFGKHYGTAEGITLGCSVVVQFDHNEHGPCNCTGFAQITRYRKNSPPTADAEAYYNR